MTRLLIALGVSVALHGLLAVGLSSGFGTTDAAREEQAPQLEVAPVDLSFADEEDATARPAQSAAASQPPPPPLPPRAMPEPNPQTPEPDGLLPSSVESSVVPPPPPLPNDTPPPEVAPPVPPENEVPPTGDASSPSVPAPQTAKVTVPPSPRKKIQPPTYPDIARKRGEEGTVLVEATVAADGHVLAVAVKASSGSRVLDLAACKAVSNAQFAPARAGETPVEGRVTVPIKFRLCDVQ